VTSWRHAARPRAAAEATQSPGFVFGFGALVVAGAGALAAYSAIEPQATLIALVVGAALTVCLLRVDIALLVLVAVIPLESHYTNAPGLPLTVTKAAGLLCFGSFALYVLVTRRRLILDYSHAIVLSVLALAVVSTLQALEVQPALTTTMRYASFVALYLVVSQFIGDRSLQRRLVWTISISASVAALIALEHFFFAPGSVYRANLRYGDPNEVAFMLATTLPLTFWLLRERWLYRPLVAVMIVVMSLAIVLTYSRGALVALGAGIVWLMVIERRRIPLLVAAGLITLAAGFTFVQSTPSNVFRVQEGLRAKEKVADYNVETRLGAWDAAVRLAIENPIVGIGPGNFTYHYGRITDTPPGADPLGVVHNAYLDIGAELGLGGLALFLAYLAVSFARLTTAHREGSGLPGYASALQVSLVIAATGSLTLSEQYAATFWLIGGLATALYLEKRVSAPKPFSAALRDVAPGWGRVG
jgi:putative inorganic carbon (HCO3(-)) transporter